MRDTSTTLVIKVPLHTWSGEAQRAFNEIVGLPGRAVTNVFTGDAEISYHLPEPMEHADAVNLVQKLRLGEVQIGQSYEVNTTANFERPQILGHINVDGYVGPSEPVAQDVQQVASEQLPVAEDPPTEAPPEPQVEAPPAPKKTKKK